MDWNYDVIIFTLKYLSLRRPRVANFVDIFKIATMFSKTTFKDSSKVKKKKKKKNRNYVLKCNLYMFLDITKVANFWWKNTDISRTLKLYICIFFRIFFRQVITVPSSVTVGYVWQMLGRGAFCSPPPLPQPPSVSSPEKTHPE